ncbi:hypothetical protein N9I21_02695 [Crocinitomicaceae bacterium]|jgi:antitoxin component YwqK of YwqJK toxin-antitoxin module|nr:hypothetical protein [Crocinitomicaceae bacterium]
MRNSLIYLIFISVIFSCQEEVSIDLDDNKDVSITLDDKLKNVNSDANLKDTVDFKCQEWYPGKKQLKIEGGLDRQNRRHGTWYYYNEEGGEMSMTTYTNGRKQGFSIVKHPNGAIYYTGEYDTDKKVGQWKFYDEKGKKVNEVNYDN